MAWLNARLHRPLLRRQQVTPAEAPRCTTLVRRPPLGHAGTPTPRPRAGMRRTIAATPAERLARPSWSRITLLRALVVKAPMARLSARLHRLSPRRRPVTPAVAPRCTT